MSQQTPPIERRAPYCAPPDPILRKPKLRSPSLACDCHAHICGPVSRFAYAEDRIYTPPDALVPDYVNLLNVIGCRRSVLVQPSVYGTDNTVLLGALDELRKRGIDCRGVAVVDPAISDKALERMHSAGVRGVRFNLVDVGDPQVRLPLAEMRRLCTRIAPLQWHAELLVHVDDYPDFDTLFGDWPVDIVTGHMGYSHVGHGVEAAGFQAMLRLAAAGRCWIKLTGPYRISSHDLPYPEASLFARTLAERVPDRLLWGTDWPHVMVAKPMPNDADLFNLLIDWMSDEGQRSQVLVANPAALYGFDSEA